MTYPETKQARFPYTDTICSLTFVDRARTTIYTISKYTAKNASSNISGVEYRPYPRFLWYPRMRRAEMPEKVTCTLSVYNSPYQSYFV